MLSKNKARFIISLQRKKIRDEEGLFVIEGDKIVKEFLAAEVPVKILVAKPEFLGSLSQALLGKVDEKVEASFEDLRQISTLKTPHNALAVVPISKKTIDPDEIFIELCCALGFVQDPGNLGTIIRAAGWFGIRNIICSPDCVDVYNPKVIQASMGAILHVNVYYNDLREILSASKQNDLPVFGAVLEGESIYEHPLGKRGVILLGNESKGISEDLLPYITSKIKIPGFSNARPGVDSLNVGMAASVIFSEFRRKILNIN
jgi:TrmH family RNA methyltransferase